MQFEPYSLFFVFALIAAGLSTYLAFSVIRKRTTPGAVSFSLLMATITLWNSSIAFGMLADSEQTAMLWISLRMIAIIFTPVLWLLFVAAYIGREKLISRDSILLLLVIPAVTVVVFLTNSKHHLFYSDVEFIRAGPFMLDNAWNFGTFFYLHLIYSVGLVLVGDLFLLQEAFRMANRYKRQARAMVIATIFPLMVTLLQVFYPVQGIQVNLDPLAFTLSGLILGWAIFDNQLFDISPIARNILIDNMIDGMMVINRHNMIVDLNPSAQRIFNITENVIGTDLDDLFDQLQLEQLEPNDQQERHHIKLVNRDGVNRFYDIQTSPILGDKEQRGTIITIRDITSQKRIEDQLQYLAITDSLTGLANHRHFYELLNNELERSKRSFEPFSVIMLDIDHFKRVNDTHGHLVGDQVLREISIECLKTLRQYDIVCRYGGEEFSIILPETDVRSAAATAERLRQAVESNVISIEDTEFNLTISLGVSCYDPYQPVSSEELVGQADSGLYHSKQTGRNRVTIHKPNHTS